MPVGIYALLASIPCVIFSPMSTPFACYLTKHGLSQRKFSRLCRLTQSTISLLARGVRSPGLAAAFAIERATDGAIPASSWAKAKKGRRVRSSHSGGVGLKARAARLIEQHIEKEPS